MPDCTPNVRSGIAQAFNIYFSVYSLVFVSIEKIYQTLQTVFHRLSKHLEFCQKHSPAHHIFNSLLISVFGYPMKTLSLMFDIHVLLPNLKHN